MFHFILGNPFLFCQICSRTTFRKKFTGMYKRKGLFEIPWGGHKT